MDIQIISGILFILHAFAGGFMFSVIRRQLGLFKKYIDLELKNFRMVLFLLSISLFIYNLVPLIINFSNYMNESGECSLSRFYYITVNALSSLTSSILIWTMYRMAAKTAVLVEADKEEALRKRRG